MQIKEVYNRNFIEKINRTMHHMVLNPSQEISTVIPIENILNSLGYQIKTINNINYELETKNKIIYIHESISHTHRRYLLARFLGQLVYKSRQK